MAYCLDAEMKLNTLKHEAFIDSKNISFTLQTYGAQSVLGG
jgi:hypothetical protein